MGSKQGFIDFRRMDFGYRSVEDRLKDFNELLVIQDDTVMKKQGARCMECDTPYCHALGCPLLNRIPEWNDYVFRKDIKGAYESLSSTNHFPEITGRICPAPCEASCSLSINLEPVTIKEIELYIIEKAYSLGLVKPIPPKHEKKERVAVIGSGPSGLGAAQELRRTGYQVVVYEKSDAIGGLLRYGLPDFKLSKWVLDRRIELMKMEGVHFKTSIEIGKNVTINDLKGEHDAVVLCVGAETPRDLPVEGRGSAGIHFALTYLTQANQCVAEKLIEEEMIHAENKNVLVIGGGDTGSDCIGTANRQGAKKVIQIEILPQPDQWNESHNPSWPDYPKILRTSTSHKEGCIREFSVSIKSFVSQNGKVKGANCVRVKWGKDSGDTYGMKEIPGSEFFIEADLVLLSMGFLHVHQSHWLNELGIQYDDKGNIKINQNYETSVNGVFATGDAATGASLVCRAIYHGRQAALSVDNYLKDLDFPWLNGQGEKVI